METKTQIKDEIVNKCKVCDRPLYNLTDCMCVQCEDRTMTLFLNPEQQEISK